MGEAAEDTLDGSCCMICGEWFHDGMDIGFPRACAGCQEPDKPDKKGKVPKVRIIIAVGDDESCFMVIKKKDAKKFLAGGDLTMHVSGYENGLLPRIHVNTHSIEWFD